jgi:hypothetical protein
VTIRLARATSALLLSCCALTGCADVGSKDKPTVTSDSSPTRPRCIPPPDALAFMIIAKMKEPTITLRRPFSVQQDGLYVIGADVITKAGATVQDGAVWVAQDLKGAGLASVNKPAKDLTTLPAASKPSADDPVVAEAAKCPKTG